KTDYNIYVFDAKGNWIDPATFPYVFYSTDDNKSTDQAMEIAELLPDPANIKGDIAQSDYQIVIGKMNSGAASHIKYVAVNTLAVSRYQGAPAIWGHTAATGGQSVAATYYAIPQFPEDFSASGPTTIYFDTTGRRLPAPEVRLVPQITAADGINNTFFGFDADLNGLPNFFGTSASAPDAAATAALVLQAAGGSGSMAPADLYSVIQQTAHQIPLPNQRDRAHAAAGPIDFQIHGDWTRWSNYFELLLDRGASGNVASVVLDSSGTAGGVIFSSTLTRFYLGASNGVERSDITVTETPDQKQYTLTFAPGSFAPGDHFHFGTSVFNPVQGSTQEDADRMRGMKITVNMEDGTSYTGTVTAQGTTGINRFTGAGLVDAAAAIRAVVKD
ncbi:MAG: S8 family serine peptidase, partial [Geminicoccaceae bacterium]